MKTPELILIIDDDNDDREFFCEAIREIDSSIQCSVSKDGFEALEFLKQAIRLPDFIFLDLNMPRMNGKICLQEIKKIKRVSSIPVIIYSTSKIEEDVLETKNLGAAGFLKKPSVFEDICTEVSGIIKNILREKNEVAYH